MKRAVGSVAPFAGRIAVGYALLASLAVGLALALRDGVPWQSPDPWLTLSPAMCAFADTLRAVHRYDAPTGAAAAKEYDETLKGGSYAAEHPLVRVHPETGERVLYVSPSFLKSLSDVTLQESQHLMQMLWEHIVRPEFTVRFRWTADCVAFWDNRSTAHLAPRDIFDSEFDRQFYRVTLNGDIPVGVDGRPSTAIEGDPIEPVPVSLTNEKASKSNV